MNVMNELKLQLQAQLNQISEKWDSSDLIGSLVFWSDDYGANLQYSKWKTSESSWGITCDNTISIENYADWESLQDDVVTFFNALRTEPKLLNLPLRQGFEFAIAFDSNSPSVIGKPLDGILDPQENMTLIQAIDVVASYVKNAITKTTPSPVQKIVFSSEEGQSVIHLDTDKSLSGEESAYHSYTDADLGYALTKLAINGDDDFCKLCDKIINEEYFINFPKRELVVFNFSPNDEEYFAMVYESHSLKLRELDEGKELRLLYSNLDDQ